MKQILFILALFCGASVFAQTATFSDIQQNNRGQYTEYLSPDNGSFKVGDTITLGKPASGQDVSGVGIAGLMGESLVPASIKHSGSQAIIKKIDIQFNTLTIKTFKPFSHSASFGFNITNIELAIAHGEVKSNVKPTVMSSEEALSKLKTEKEKLDLGVITPEQYEMKKKELIKFIK